MEFTSIQPLMQCKWFAPRQPSVVTITSRESRQSSLYRATCFCSVTYGQAEGVVWAKTGTLTENQMTVQAIFAGGAFYVVTGDGYEAAGQIWLNKQKTTVAPHSALAESLRCGLRIEGLA
jgi:Ca2+-transporting ATPase